MKYIEWIVPFFCIIGTLSVYFGIVRGNEANIKSFSRSLCPLFLLRHMLPDGHFFSFMYCGLPRNQYHPRLLWPCVATFVGLFITSSSFVWAVIFNVNFPLIDNEINVCVSLSHLAAIIIIPSIFVAIPTIQNNKCFKEISLFKMAAIEEEIEQKWPGFYSTDDKTEKSKRNH